jgi:hypothetical protein
LRRLRGRKARLQKQQQQQQEPANAGHSASPAAQPLDHAHWKL